MTSKPRLIRYLENGEYKYASVKDIGDLNSLLTEEKSDIVSAINYLFSSGGASGVSPEAQAEFDKVYGRINTLDNATNSVSEKVVEVQGVIDTVSQKATSLETSQNALKADLDESLQEIQTQKEAQITLSEELAKKLDSTQYTQEYELISSELQNKANQLALDATNKDLGVVTKTTIPALENAIGQKLSITTYDDAVGVNKWVSSVYPVATGINLNTTAPTFDMFKGVNPTSVEEVVDEAIIPVKSGTNQITHLFARVYLKVAKTISLNILFDDSIAIYMNGASVYQSKFLGSTRGTASLSLRTGWNTIEILHGQATGTPVLDLGTKISSLVDRFTSVVGVGDKNETRLSRAETELIQTTEKIELKASQTDVANIGNRVTSAEGQLVVQSNQIASKVSQSTFDGYTQRVTNAESNITQLSDTIATKVAKTDYDNLNSKVTTQATTITQLSDSITTKANKTDVDALSGRVSTTETSIVQANNAIALKASQSSLDTLSGRVTNAESSITTQADQIALKVAKTDMNSVSALNTLHNAEWLTSASKWSLGTGWSLDTTTKFQSSNTMKQIQSGATANNYYPLQSENISATAGDVFTGSIYVMTDDYTKFDQGATIEIDFFNSSNARISYPATSMALTSNSVWQRFTVTGTAPVGTTYARLRVHVGKNGRLWVARPMLQTGIFASIFTPHVDELATDLISRVSGAETSITQTNNAVALKANVTDVYTKTETDGKVTTAVTNAKSEIKATTDSITSTVSSISTSVDNLGTKVDSQATEIKQTKDDISLNVVKKDSIVASINASSEGIKMVASKIDLTGAVTINALDDTTKAKVNNAFNTTSSYNGVKIDATSGIVVTKSDNKVRTKMNATEGFKIQKSSDGVNYQDVLYADTNGVLYAKGLVIDSSSSIGGTMASTVVDNASNGAIAQSTVVNNQNVWGRASNINSDGTFNTTKLSGQVADAQIASASNWSLAKTRTDDMLSDMKVTPLEKSQLSRDWESIKAEYTQLSTQAVALGVTSTSYTTSYTNLDSTSPRIAQDVLAVMNTTYTFVSTSARDLFRTQINTYFAESQKLRKAISDKIQSNVDSVTVGGRNLLPNSAFASLSNSSSITSKHDNLYADYYGGYNAGITNPTTSYHAHVDTNTFGYPVYEYNESDGTRNWKAISVDLTNLVTEAGDYRLSLDAFQTLLGGKLFGGFYYTKQGTTTTSFHSGQYVIESTIGVNTWSRSTALVKLNNDVDWTKPVSFYIYGYGFSSNTVVYMKKPKLEKGTISSEWTPSNEDVQRMIDSANSNAIKANNMLSDMASDSKVTPTEKVQLKKEWSTIIAEKSTYESLATTYGITTEKTDFTTAYNNLNTSLNGSGGVLVDMTATSTVVGTTFRGTFNAYYDKKALLIKKVNEMSRTIGVNAQSTIDSNKPSWDLAKTRTDDMLSDMKVTPLEKSQLSRDWESIKAEYGQLSAQATALGVVSTAYVTAYTNLDGVTPRIATEVLASMSITYTFASTTARDLFKTQLNAYFAESQKLRKAVNDKIQSNVDNITIGGANLLTNSASSITTSPNDVGFGASVQTTLNGESFVRITPDSTKAVSQYRFLGSLFTTKLVVGSQYTLSLDVRPNADGKSNLYVRNGANDTNLSTSIQRDIKANVWTRISTTFTCDSSSVSELLMITTFDGIGKILDTKNWKLEKANVSSDWSPAPEDVQLLVSNASADAKKANDMLADMASDSKITPTEKVQLKKEWATITAEKVTYEALATTFGITTEKTNYSTSYNNLNTVLNGTGGVLLDMVTTSSVVGSTFRATFDDYYDKKALLIKKVNETSRSIGTTAQTTANSKSKTFTSQPTIPYSIGDIWVQGASGDVMHCVVSRTSGSYTASDWVKSTKYTDDTMANTASELATAISSGRMIYTDPTFKSGVNNLQVYNNSGNGAVTVSRITKPADAPTISGYAVEVKTTALANPNWGGVIVPLQARSGAKFIVKMIAKIPVGYTLNIASNLMGNGYSDRIITSNQGTGKYEEYIRLVKCGVDGAMSGGGHFYLSGGTTPTVDAPLVWNIAYATAYDVADIDSTIYDMVSDLKITPLEKNQLSRDWEAIKAEYTNINAQATSTSVSATAYTNAYNALDSGTPKIQAEILANMSTTYEFPSASARDLFKSQMVTYFSEREKIRKAISDAINSTAGSANSAISTNKSIWDKASNINADGTFNTGKLSGQVADTQITSASNWNSARSAVLDMSNDNKLTPIEKQSLKIEFDQIVKEKAQGDIVATTYGITTEKANYGASYTTLYNYVNPLLASLTTTSDITGATLRSYFNDYYDKATILSNAINTKAKSLADFAQATADAGINKASITKNALFNDWGATHANYPTGMNYWGTASLARKETSAVRDGSNALRFSGVTTADAGATLSTPFFKAGVANPKYLVVELGFYLVSGSPTGAGILLDWTGMASPNRAQATLQEMTPETIVTGKWYNATKVLKRPTDNITGFTSVSGYLMANYVGLGTKVDKDIIYDRLLVREASIEEIKAYEADIMISDMSSDGKITPVEKVQLKKEWATISSEKVSYEGLATTYGITTEKTNYVTSYNNLNTLLNGTNGVLLSMTTTSTVTATTFRATFDDYYDKKALLIKKVNETSRSLANSAQGTANTANTTANTVTTLTNGWKASDGVQINGGKVMANSITSREISVTSLSALSANLGTVTAGDIKGVNIDGSNFTASGYTKLDETGKGDRGSMNLNSQGMRYNYTFDSGNTSYPSGDGYSWYDSEGLIVSRTVGGLGGGTTKLNIKGLSYSGSGGSYNGGFNLVSDNDGKTILESTGGDLVLRTGVNNTVVESDIASFKKHVRIDGNLDLTQSTSKLTMPSNVYYTTGSGALDMKNSDITGANAIVFNDPSDTAGEGLLFLKDGKTSGSTSSADYDNLKAKGGVALFNDNSILHEGDIQIQTGYVSITPKPNIATDLIVKFPKAFSGTPRVMVSPNTTIPGYYTSGTWVSGVSSAGASSTQFTCFLTRNNDTPTGVAWVAVYGGSR